MRILLSECVDRRLADFIAGHQVRTVVGERWSGLRDPQLLERAAGRFDAMVTTDQNLPFQQNLAKYSLPVVILVPESKGFEGLMGLVPQLLEVLDSPEIPMLCGFPDRLASEGCGSLFRGCSNSSPSFRSGLLNP